MAIIESFASVVSLASAFGSGRDAAKIIDLLEFQNWLIDCGNKELADAIEESQTTSIYIKAILNQQLPLIFEALNNVAEFNSDLPRTIKTLMNTNADILVDALSDLEQRIVASKPDISNHLSSNGDRSPIIVNSGNGNVDVHVGDTIASQVSVGNIINKYGISLEDHEAALKKREQEFVERLSKTEPSDRLVREMLEKELNAVIEKLSNLNQSYQEELAIRKAVEITLKEIKEELPDLQSDAALERLHEGDTEAAKLLFDKVIEKADQTNELAGKAAFEIGRMAKNEIRYFEARNYFQKAVRFQPENSEYNNAVGLILYDLADYQGAIKYHQLALAGDLKTYGEDHPNVANRHNNLGSAYQALGQYQKAIEYHQLALISNLKACGEDHPNVAICRDSLGSAYQALGRYQKAIEYHQLALTSNLKVYGENHPDVAICRNNLGAAYRALGSYHKAIEYYQLALASDLKTYGEDHPNVAISRNNLGAAYKALCQYDKAIEHIQLALDSDLKTYGEDHPKVALRRSNSGSVYYALGQYQKAIEHIQLALDSGLKTYGEDHPDVAMSRNNLGMAYQAMGQYQKAIEHYQSALKTFERIFGEDHPSSKTVASNLRSVRRQSE
jgi:tetratricopeptide (TPR) repeat protein